ncbi:hypothetical protein QUW15_10785 [Desulfovibrio piger]|nr:hypothetical protein [Desulfovibrio piger]
MKKYFSEKENDFREIKIFEEQELRRIAEAVRRFFLSVLGKRGGLQFLCAEENARCCA